MGTSFAERLRALTDEALSGLLRSRPDLVTPIPADITALAARAQTRLSVARVLDGLDLFTLEILDAARLTRSDDGYTSTDAIIALAAVPTGGPEPIRVRAAVQELITLFLLYGPDDELRVAGAVDEIRATTSPGWGAPPAPSTRRPPRSWLTLPGCAAR